MSHLWVWQILGGCRGHRLIIKWKHSDVPRPAHICYRHCELYPSECLFFLPPFLLILNHRTFLVTPAVPAHAGKSDSWYNFATTSVSSPTTSELFFLFVYLFLFIWLHWVLLQHVGSSVFLAGCGIFHWGKWNLISWPGIEPGTPALGMWGLNHWTTRESPASIL